MKYFNVGLCAIVFIVFGLLLVNANPLFSSNNRNNAQNSLGDKHCTWGPSHWCKNFSNAKNCHATRHCIQTVWELTEVPVDNDSICQICKDMVQQARDQLRSNETMEELKEVFEGSCRLIHIKPVVKECCRLADDFIPELVEALSSQMNPDQVCTVAGLCNNAELDEKMKYYYQAALDGTLTEEPEHEVVVATEKPKEASPNKHQLTCGNCNSVATLVSTKFQASNRDDILENILRLCGELSSFSDACSNIVLSYFNDIYDHLKQFFDASGICHVSGVCSAKYHQHPEDAKETSTDDLTAIGSVGGDDIPCELCEQLVRHLRDVLVANTTETEFKQVLEGLCSQTKGFKAECLSIVDQYYDVIYHTLVNDLNPNGACFLIGVCPKGKNVKFEHPIMPLLPAFPPAEIKVTIRKKLGENEPKYTQNEIGLMQLPIDHLIGAANPGLLTKNGELCTLCEYFLHFVQETLSESSTADNIKHAVETICQKMPNSVRGPCDDFVEQYGDAVIALLVQGLNPRDVCPRMQMCPTIHAKHDDMEVFDPKPVVDHSDKPTCPLCLFALEEAQAKIKDDKSKAHIQSVLNSLCSHLPEKLQAECVDFVHTYSNELVDKLISDFAPTEICVAIKLCPKTNDYLNEYGISGEDDNSSEENYNVNEIEKELSDLPIEVIFDETEVAPNCWLCEEFIKNAEKRIGKHKSKEEIVKILKDSCQKLKKNIRPKCSKYIEKHGDKIATLILKEMEPKIICSEIGLCILNEQEDLEIDEALKYDVILKPNTNMEKTSERLIGLDDLALMQDPPSCVLCEFVMTKLEIELQNKTTQDEIKHAIEHICERMPKSVTKSCNKFVEQYASAILSLIGIMPPKEICHKLALCFDGLGKFVTEEVVECGVCHGASIALVPYFKQHLDHSAIGVQDMVTVACENVPAKYYQTCAEMISIYGRSILNLSQKNYVDEAHICSEIGKCFDTEKSGLAFARIIA